AFKQRTSGCRDRQGIRDMEKYYQERFEAQRRLMKKIAPFMEVNDILEMNHQINETLVRDVDPINVNIGINSGQALLGMTRFKGILTTRMTYTASGTVTNLASRLASHAKGGDVLIGEKTKDLIDGLWPVYDRGECELKGIDEPVRIYSLIRKTSAEADQYAL
ncbi:MAG: adenylate/guanylate cyclase domain-containing protein, partial [Pseudomonadota bacterium]